MLVLFVQLVPGASPYDYSNDIYELLDISTQKRFLIKGSVFARKLETGYFHSLSKTEKFVDQIPELLKETLLKLVITTK